MSLLENEGAIEALKNRLRRTLQHPVTSFFEFIDCDQDGFVSEKDLKEFIVLFAFESPSEKEIGHLMHRMDQFNEGGISIGQFAKQMS